MGISLKLLLNDYIKAGLWVEAKILLFEASPAPI